MTDEPGASHSAPVKPRTCRELEHALLTLGFSRREAKAITSKGFGGMAAADPEEDLSEIAALLQRNTKLIESKS